MTRFQMPLHLQVMCDGVPDCEFLGSSIRIPRDRTPKMAKLIAKAKSALKSKPKRKMHPPFSTEEIQAMLVKSKRCKSQQITAFDQVRRQQHHHHPDFATTTAWEITPSCKLVNFMPILNVGLSKMMEVDEEATPMHWQDTQEDTKANNKRVKLTAGN